MARLFGSFCLKLDRRSNVYFCFCYTYRVGECFNFSLTFMFQTQLYLMFLSITLAVMKDFKYADSHEWVKVDGTSATIGITDHAQVNSFLFCFFAL